jgi:hypothetical protein
MTRQEQIAALAKELLTIHGDLVFAAKLTDKGRRAEEVKAIENQKYGIRLAAKALGILDEVLSAAGEMSRKESSDAFHQLAQSIKK